MERGGGVTSPSSAYQEHISSGQAVNHHMTPKAYDLQKSERDYNKKKSRIAKISLGNDEQFQTLSDSRETLFDSVPKKFSVPNLQQLKKEGQTNHYEFGMQPHLFDSI